MKLLHDLLEVLTVRCSVWPLNVGLAQKCLLGNFFSKPCFELRKNYKGCYSASMKALMILSLLLTLSSTAWSAGEEFVYRGGAISSAPVISGEGLKVFWWNIGCSSTKGLSSIPEALRPDFNPVNQWKNIEALVNDEQTRPDVLILGEYCPKYFQQKTYDLLKETYPHIHRLNKSNEAYKIRNGLRVFSKTRIKVLNEGVLQTGDFLDSSVMKTCYENKRGSISAKYFNKDFWERPLIELEIEKGEKKYKVSPVHLANPWVFIKNCIGYEVGFELISGENNPNYNQALQVVDYFSEKDSTVMIGDFNAAKSVFGSMSNPYYILEQAFGESVIESEENTYIDRKVGLYSRSIDHAFVSEDLIVQDQKVLPFAGSDHLPIYIVVE